MRFDVGKDCRYWCGIDPAQLRVASYDQARKLPLTIQDPCPRITMVSEELPATTVGEESPLNCLMGRIRKMNFGLQITPAAFGEACASAELVHHVLAKLAGFLDTVGMWLKDIFDSFKLSQKVN